jgi:NAD-reducing hydrogenase large subunit
LRAKRPDSRIICLNMTKIVIDPVTRIEGHGKVTIHLDEAGSIGEARFHVVEFRGFERFIRGRPYWEVPMIVQRLCGICPVSHHLCSAKTMDLIAGVDRLTPTAEKVRRLMHYGQVLQSNAVHFFHLASPDLLFGFDGPIEQRNIVGMIDHFPEIAKWAIFVRKFGQEIIKMLGGKKIHPSCAIPGGVNKNLSIQERDALRSDIDQVTVWSVNALDLCKRLIRQDARRLEDFGTFASAYVSIVREDGAMDLYDGMLRAIDYNGAKVFDGVTPAMYDDYIGEYVRPWSYMKFPYIRSLGKELGWYRVGPLAQLNCCDFIDTPLAENARREFKQSGTGGPVHATLYQHWARVICMVHAAEKIGELLRDDDLQGDDLVVRGGARRAEGAAWLEAPRGTLFHRYRIDQNELVTDAKLVVATTNNNEAINRSIKKVAVDYLTGQEITEALLNHIEVAIRAYDPCLSCATHALGDMPLIVTLERHDGELLASRTRG